MKRREFKILNILFIGVVVLAIVLLGNISFGKRIVVSAQGESLILDPESTFNPTDVTAPTDAPDPTLDEALDNEDDLEGLIFEVESADDTAVGSGTYDSNNSNVKYKKAETWTKNVKMPAPLTGVFARSNTKGAVTLLKFKGSKISVSLRKGQNAGQVLIKVKKVGGDVFKKLNKDLYKSGEVKFREFTIDGLNPDDTYIIRVRVTGNKNNSSKNTVVGFEKFSVFSPDGLNPTNTPGPGATNTPGGATNTPTPTGGDDYTLTKYEIPIGTKASLTINIGGTLDVTPTPTPTPTGEPPDTAIPNVRFSTKLYQTDGHPDIKVRVKVVDLLAQVTPAPQSDEVDYCQNPAEGEYFIDNLTLSANSSGVYTPKAGTNYIIRKNGAEDIEGIVASDGWVGLESVTGGRRYMLIVKGPKHVAEIMEDNVVLNNGAPASQSYNWEDNPLMAGDVPDPSSDNLQDCVVNSNDVSLVKNRMGSTDESDFNTADLDYNDIVNAADMGLLTYTLSTKPDED